MIKETLGDKVLGPLVPVFKCQQMDAWTWRFLCPECKQYHYHGTTPGHRTSHCKSWPNGYFIEAQE
jgi:hypothetical protein